MARRTDVLVLAQAVTAAGVLWPGRVRWSLSRPIVATAVVAMIGGGALAVAGVRELGRDLTPFVDPRADASLHTGGVFGVTRNPVYAGLLAGAWAVAVLRRRPEPLVAATCLSVVLHVKAGVEEGRLSERFGDTYDAYRGRTPRLVPSPRACIRAAVTGLTRSCSSGSRRTGRPG